jgi:hypothetical protein
MQFFEGASQFTHAQKPTYFCGLDLGQQQDYSALVVLERRGFTPQNYTFDCRHLHRWQLKTSFPEIVTDTTRWMNSESLNKGVHSRTTLAIDKTGCGAPVYDLFKREKMHARIVPIMITGGDSISRDGDTVRVPKRNLVSHVSVALQTGKLKFSEELPLTKILTAELQNFKAKISTAGHDSYGAANDWRIGSNDDLVLALSMALFCANGGGVNTGTLWTFE